MLGKDNCIILPTNAADPFKEASQTLVALIAASPAAIICVDCDGNVRLWNPAAETLFGWTADEVLGKAIPVISRERRELYDQVRQDVFNGETITGLEVDAVAKDGRLVSISVSIAPLRDAEGKVWGAMDIVLDITSRKQAEGQIKLQAAALESTANAVVITDPTGKIIWTNPAFTTLTGYSSTEVIGKTPSVLRSGEHPREFFTDLWHTILDGKVWRGEIVNRRKDGSLYSEVQTVNPVRDARGEIAHFVAIKEDITERKRLTQQLYQAQKMESVGRLAGGVAHDFNNLLSVIIGYSDLLLEDLSDEETARTKIEEIRKAGQRASSLTRQLLAFSRQQVLEPRILNLNTCIAETEKMLRRLIGEDIELNTYLDSTLGPVKTDPAQIEQVIMNLAVNARDAMPKGGKLVIETTNVDLGDEYARNHPPLPAGRYILLAVTDTGVGMDRETQAHIFEPFFSTKEIGKGTGLGLSTVYGIVKQSAGYIWVYSELGKGTAFKIYLPRVDGTPQQRLTTGGAPELLEGTGTILLVEDEPSVRLLTLKLLEHCGYKVLEANDALQALEIAGQQRAPIHLLLTDVVMPGMNGPSLAAKVLEAHPETRTLYFSGYSGSFMNQSGLIPAGATLLQKPFSRETLLRKVKDILAAPAN